MVAKIRPVLLGLLAAILLLGVYFTILGIANSLTHAVEQFIQVWYWIMLLVIGFGIQIGLYSYIRMKAREKAAKSTVIATGGVSTSSMIACCLHHLADVLPIMGLSAAATFLTEYQTIFIIIGILSNFVGISMMLRIMQQHMLYDKSDRLLSSIMKMNTKKILYLTTTLSALIIILTVSNKFWR